jgi:hypothetical protein
MGMASEISIFFKQRHLVPLLEKICGANTGDAGTNNGDIQVTLLF